MSTVLLGVAGFSLVILSLVVLLLAARRRLVASGEVTIRINDDPENDIKTPAGGTLLGTLSANRLFLPSACGGKGSCGVCTVRVLDGGGAVLPTERGHLTRGEERCGVRLSCQVKVKQDMRLAIPPELFRIRKWTCRVRSNHNVATFIKELILELPAGEEVPFRAGGYIQIECPPYEVSYREFEVEDEYRDDWDRFDMWKFRSRVEEGEEVVRAYSMANYPEEKGVIMLNVRVASPPPRQPDVPPGKMTSWLFNLRPGDEVTISGPYGEFYGGVLSGRLRPDRRRMPQLRLEAGPFGAPPRGQLERLHRLHPPGPLRQLPERTPESGGRRVLPLRSAAHAEGLPRDARQSRGGTREHRLRRLRLELSPPSSPGDWRRALPRRRRTSRFGARPSERPGPFGCATRLRRASAVGSRPSSRKWTGACPAGVRTPRSPG